MNKTRNDAVTTRERSVSLNPMNPLIASYLTQLKAEGKSPATIEARYWFLTAVDADLAHGICDVLPEEIAAYMAYEHWSPWTRATYFGHLAGFYAYAVDHDPRMGYNPMAGMKRPPGGHGLPKPTTDEELAYAWANSDDWWKLVIALASYGGLRRAEIAVRDRDDINADWIRVEHGKGDQTRLVPTHPQVWELVESAPTGRLLRGVFGRPVPAQRLGMLARAHFDAIGLPGMHLHGLRHYFATKLVLCGVNLMVVKELLGHATLATTQRYVHITEGQRRLAVNSLPSLNGHPAGSPSAGQADMIPTHRPPTNVPSSATMKEAS